MWSRCRLKRRTSLFLLVLAGLAAAPPSGVGEGQTQAGPPKPEGEAVLRAEGPDGVATLRLFPRDAAEMFAANRGAFRDLKLVAQLDAPLQATCSGPWSAAVVRWARAGRLRPFLARLRGLDHNQRRLMERVPACLPLLGLGAWDAEAMIDRHGERAWRLFLTVAFEHGIDDVERVARALREHGEAMLRINESHGPTLALLFVPPPDDVTGTLPRLFAKAVDRLGADNAGALFLGNYDDLIRLMVEERRPADDLIAACTLLAGQPDEVRALAADSGRAVRLLLERWAGEPIGGLILARCGPAAADLLFKPDGSANHPAEKPAALAILARLGWPGLELLDAMHGDPAWHQLLRRTELMGPGEEPLIVRLARRISSSSRRQDEIEHYRAMPRAQILEEQMPPGGAAQVLAWVPGYNAMRTTARHLKGYQVEPSETAEALFDAVRTVMLVGKLVNQGVKVVGKAGGAAVRAVEKRAIKELAGRAPGQTARTLAARLPGSLTSLMRTLPDQVGRIDITQLARLVAATGKKVGVRTWGRLDRRIIQRGDRHVIIVLDPKEIGKEALDQAKDAVIEHVEQLWDTIAREPGEFGPCLMERVVPGLAIEPEAWPKPQAQPAETAVRPPASAPVAAVPSPRVWWRSAGPGGGAVVLCLVAVLGGVVLRSGRRRGPSVGQPPDRPRPYRE